MARYQIIEQGWPVGAYLISAGAVLDTADWQWNGVRRQIRRRLML